MSIEKMSLVQIIGSVQQLDTALLRCCESEIFHLDHPSVSMNLEGFQVLEEENPFTSPFQAVSDVLTLLSIQPRFENYDSLNDTMEQQTEYVKSMKAQAVRLSKDKSHILDDLSIYQQAFQQVEHLKGLTVEFETIMSSKNVTARFGRLPVDSFLKLDYFASKTFFFFDFDHDENYHWGVYLSPNTTLVENDRIFNSLYFEHIDIPDFARGTPEQSAAAIQKMITEQEEKLKECEERFSALKQEHQQKLLQIYSILKMKNDTFAYRRYATTAHNQFYLKGFVPSRQVKEFNLLFEDLEQIVCEEEPVENNRNLEPPVKLRTNWFFKPFEMFVKMYGLPGYYDLNPTTFIGFIYVILFGIMFGDLGQGAVICLLGVFLWKKKKMELGAIMSRLGISSMVFGCAYGSVFGYEHVLDPIFKIFGFLEKPIEVFHPQTTNMLLISAVGIGVVIIISCIGLNIYLGFKKKDFNRAVLSNNGIVGLVIYAGSILAAVLMLTSGINLFNPIFILLVIVLPMLILMFREPIHQWLQRKKNIKLEGGLAGFLMQNFFELFEVCLSFITNTLSFLRIGGFILSHAGMMAVVMSLSQMLGDGGIVAVIIGNIFVMALEGLLAGIQVLRLVFYETFSRFYEGDGKPFTPAKVEFPQSDTK